MKKIGADIPKALESLGRDVPNAQQKARAAQVCDMWKTAVEEIYKASAACFLDHTNAVYLMRKDDVRTLIVYVDESIFAADLNAQRELFKLKFLDRFNEQIEVFEIHISRGSYKNQHPYRVEEGSGAWYAEQDKKPSVPLTPVELDEACKHAGVVEDTAVRRALLRAMVADRDWKKGQSDKNNT